MVEYSVNNDFVHWIKLVKEVEPLFGEMVGNESFRNALEISILEKRALCIRDTKNGILQGLKGGIIISRESNEILWLAVAEKEKGQGLGNKLLEAAIKNLDKEREITVQTFDKSVVEGEAARRLYLKFGFQDYKKSGNNPAGIPTVIMKRGII